MTDFRLFNFVMFDWFLSEFYSHWTFHKSNWNCVTTFIFQHTSLSAVIFTALKSMVTALKPVTILVKTVTGATLVVLNRTKSDSDPEVVIPPIVVSSFQWFVKEPSHDGVNFLLMIFDHSLIIADKSRSLWTIFDQSWPMLKSSTELSHINASIVFNLSYMEEKMV